MATTSGSVRIHTTHSFTFKRPPLICVFFEEGRRIVCVIKWSVHPGLDTYFCHQPHKSTHHYSKKRGEHAAARGGRVKKHTTKGKMGFHLKIFYNTTLRPIYFSYNDIFVSPPAFHQQKERGREGHNRKGDETSINFFDRTTVPGMERAQE